jgi:GDP-4-dehydro-6-deoxy-D-mannose reductase
LRSLITGVNGFAGSHLADLLLAQGESDVWGCDLSAARRSYLPAQVELLAADLRDAQAVRQVIEQTRPERIYHLAGQAFVGDSWAHPWETLETNLRSQVNLLEAVVASDLRPSILVVGSADEYGRMGTASEPIDETRPLRPDSPYSVSKAAQDLLGLQYFLSYHLPVIRVRPFNHIGPRQNHKFVAAAFASQIAAIEAGQQPPVMQVGNLDARRDFTDVRDTVHAYVLLLERGEAGEVYNIGTGVSYRIQYLLDVLLGLARRPITVQTDPSRIRPNDAPDLVCDAGRLTAATGWRPRFTIEQTLSDLLDYERSLLGTAPALGRQAAIR